MLLRSQRKRCEFNPTYLNVLMSFNSCKIIHHCFWWTFSLTINNVLHCICYEQYCHNNTFLHILWVALIYLSLSGHQSGFCMICIMQNHIIQAFANTGNAIKPVSFIRDLKSKTTSFLQPGVMWLSSLCPQVSTQGCHRHLVLGFNTAKVMMTQHWPQCPMWQEPVTAVQKWSAETAGWEWTPGREEVRVAPWQGEVLCCSLTGALPPSLPTYLPPPYVLLQSCLHLLRLFFFFSISPSPSSPFPDALSVSLWLRAERRGLSTNVQSALSLVTRTERCTVCVFMASLYMHHAGGHPSSW